MLPRLGSPDVLPPASVGEIATSCIAGESLCLPPGVPYRSDPRPVRGPVSPKHKTGPQWPLSSTSHIRAFFRDRVERRH